jgi:hypothetical protein
MTAVALSVWADGEFDWSEFGAIVALPPLPDGFPRPTGGRVRVAGELSSDGQFRLCAAADLAIEPGATMLGIGLGPRARFEFCASYAADDFAAIVDGGSTLAGEVFLDTTARLPEIPAFAGLTIDSGDEAGFIGLRFRARAGASGELDLSASIADPVSIALQVPGMPQPQPPLSASLDRLELQVDAATSPSLRLGLGGRFELRPFLPDIGLPIAQYVAPILGGLPALSGDCSLVVGFGAGAPSLDFSASVDAAGFEVDLFGLLAELSRGLGGPPGAAPEVPLEANFGFRIVGVEFTLGGAAPSPGGSAPFAVALRLEVSLGAIKAVGGFRLSDQALSIGIDRMVIPLAIPRFPIGKDEFEALYADPHWRSTLESAIAALAADGSASGRQLRSRLQTQLALMQAVFAVRGDFSPPGGYRMAASQKATYRGWLATLFGALDAATSVAAPSGQGTIYRISPLTLDRLRDALVPDAVVATLESLAGTPYEGEAAFAAALATVLDAPAADRWQALLFETALVRGATLRAQVAGEVHAVAEDLNLVLKDVRFAVPLSAPRDIGVSGSAQIRGFTGPYAFLDQVTMTLGLSADLIYFSLDAADGTIPIPAVGRYSGGSVSFSEFRLGFGYTKRSLAVAFAGGVVLPRQLVDDLDSSDITVAGIRLPVQTRLAFRFELMPVPVVKVVPLLQFDLDLRQNVSPGLVDSRLAIPYWDGLQVIVPGVVHTALKRIAFSPIFACVPAPNYAFDGDLVLGDERNGLAVIVDDLLAIGAILVGAGGITIPIPAMCDGTPFVENYCIGVRVAGFALNFNLQRPFPSFSPLALFELLALLSDPEHYQVDPRGELANSLRVTLRDAYVVLPDAVRPLFPGSEAVVGRSFEITINLADYIAAAQAIAAVIKPVVLRAIDTMRAGADDAADITAELQALAANAAAGNWRDVLALVPAEVRKVAISASFGGFGADAWLLLMTHDEALAEIGRRNKPAKARPKPKPLKPGQSPSASALRSIGFALPTKPGGSPPHDPSDPAHNALRGEAFDWVDTKLLKSLAPPDAGGAVMVGAEVRVFGAWRQRFFGWLASDGGFALMSQAGLPPLALPIAGIEVALPLAFAGRLALVRRADGAGLMRGDFTATWDPIPGLVHLSIGKKTAPATIELRSDGRFRVEGSALAKFAGDACRVQGRLDASESHAHLDGALTFGDKNLLRIELAAAGRFGPGQRFELAGAGEATLLGMALAEVEGRLDERRLAISARFAVEQWCPPGRAPTGIDLDLRLAGSVDLRQPLPNFRLEGSGRVGLFGAEIASGRCGVECRPKKTSGHDVLTWIEGALAWHGHEWLNARIELGAERFAIRGRTALDFDVTPPGAPIRLMLVLNVDAAIGLGLADGGLDTLAARGDWLIGVRAGREEGDGHIVPIAVGRLPPISKATLPFVLVRVPGFALPKLDWSFELPVPKLEFGEPIKIKLPDSVTLPSLVGTDETKAAQFFDLNDLLSVLGVQTFTYLKQVAYSGSSATPKIDLDWLPDIEIPTSVGIEWKGAESLPLPFDEVPGFTLVLDWDREARRFVIVGELKPPAPKVHVEFDPKGIDIVGEFVSILNDTGQPIDLGGWVLHDAASLQRRYTFPPVTLAPGDEVKVWSKEGADDNRNLYWGRRQAVWNNTGDVAVLRDARGTEIVRVGFGGEKATSAGTGR